MGKSLRSIISTRNDALKSDRSHYMGDWQELSDFVLGSRGQFLVDKNEKGHNKRNERLYNEVAKQAAHTLASGMMAGITSPSRPWFKLSTPDPEMEEFGPVKLWLDEVQKIMLTIFARSGFYNAMHSIYLELGVFGTACEGMYENYDNVMRYEPYTIGSYSLAANGERKVDTLYREYSITVEAAVHRFGLKNLSRAARNLWDNGNYDKRVEILHAIEPNRGRDFGSPLAKDMAYRSVYIEVGADGDDVLKHSGFKTKPFISPRWDTVGDGLYATSYPGINSLASNKSLQIEELDKAIAIEKMHNPPLMADAAIQTSGADLIAGGITYIPNMGNSPKPSMAPVYEVAPQIDHLRQDINEKENRINRFFFADLFLMLTEIDRSQITATEIAERKEEKMLMLGPVLESLNTEALDPHVDRCYEVAEEAGILPPPPPELRDQELKVEYISVLAQAQKSISTAGIESTVAFASEVAQVWPEARHKIDGMQVIDEYAKAKGASPKIIRSDDDAIEAAEAEQQQAQMAEQAAMVAQAVESGQTLSQTETGEGSALEALLG